MHQSADIFWAAVWGRLVGSLPRGRQAVTVAAWLPWALLTAAVEYHLVLPWLQPLVRMQVPYWTAATVHLASGAAYPLYPWVREGLSERSEDGAGGARAAAVGLAAALAALALVAGLGRRDREPPWPFADEEARELDRRFLGMMYAHHEQGAQLSRLAADRAVAAELRVLGRLMLAEHESELEVMEAWWGSWYGGDVPEPTREEHESMPGMQPQGEVEELELRDSDDFEQRFLELMLPHHEGAIAMADDARARAGGDPRIRLFADAIRHAQRGQIERMSAHRG